VHEASDTEFAAKLGTYLDIPQFAKFLAGTVVTGSLDTILMMGHNFYIVRNPKSGKYEFLPWDLDLAFGGFPGGGIDATQLSIEKPVGDREILIKRFLAVPAAKASYLAACKAAVTILEGISSDIDLLTERVAPVKKLEENTQGPGGPGRPDGPGGPGGPSGFSAPAAASATKDAIFVVSGNRILKFSANGLTLESSAQLPATEGDGIPGGPFRGPGGPGGPGGFGRNVNLNDFIKQRIEQVKLQLSGKSAGVTPRSMGAGGPGRP